MENSNTTNTKPISRITRTSRPSKLQKEIIGDNIKEGFIANDCDTTKTISLDRTHVALQTSLVDNGVPVDDNVEPIIQRNEDFLDKAFDDMMDGVMPLTDPESLKFKFQNLLCNVEQGIS